MKTVVLITVYELFNCIIARYMSLPFPARLGLAGALTSAVIYIYEVIRGVVADEFAELLKAALRGIEMEDDNNEF